MRTGQVLKEAKGFNQAQEMALVNRYARRELSIDDVYLFTVVLCDNEIDRDFESFPVESLEKLSELFVGKTGIVDHDPSAKNQKARIISCAVEKVEGKKTKAGEDYHRLTARAYILRNEENQALIDAVDAGIIKEVSVGCSVKTTRCSICHEDIYSLFCSHHKGEIYDGELCFGALCDPTDAYEFSFVAVPAQREAGVIKSLQKRKETGMQDKLKNAEQGEEITLSYDECQELKTYLEKLERDSIDAKAYREQTRKELFKKLSPYFLGLSAETAKAVSEKLSASQMRELCSAFKASRSDAPTPALYRGGTGADASKITQFTI